MRNALKIISRFLCAILFLLAGYYHFARPDLFNKAMPSWIPAPIELIYFTGICEIAGGLGLAVPNSRLQRLTAKCLAVFLVMVFPVNINMALNPQLFPSLPGSLLWGRLLLQPLLIALVLWSTNCPDRTGKGAIDTFKSDKPKGD